MLTALAFALETTYLQEDDGRSKHALTEIVVVDQEILHGTPCFANTRVPGKTLIDFLETGESINDFLAVYSYIPRQQILSYLKLSRNITIDQITCASL